MWRFLQAAGTSRRTRCAGRRAGRMLGRSSSRSDKASAKARGWRPLVRGSDEKRRNIPRVGRRMENGRRYTGGIEPLTALCKTIPSMTLASFQQPREMCGDPRPAAWKATGSDEHGQGAYVARPQNLVLFCGQSFWRVRHLERALERGTQARPSRVAVGCSSSGGRSGNATVRRNVRGQIHTPHQHMPQD